MRYDEDLDGLELKGYLWRLTLGFSMVVTILGGCNLLIDGQVLANKPTRPEPDDTANDNLSLETELTISLSLSLMHNA